MDVYYTSAIAEKKTKQSTVQKDKCVSIKIQNEGLLVIILDTLDSQENISKLTYQRYRVEYNKRRVASRLSRLKSSPAHGQANDFKRSPLDEVFMRVLFWQMTESREEQGKPHGIENGLHLSQCFFLGNFFKPFRLNLVPMDESNRRLNWRIEKN